MKLADFTKGQIVEWTLSGESEPRTWWIILGERFHPSPSLRTFRWFCMYDSADNIYGMTMVFSVTEANRDKFTLIS